MSNYADLMPPLTADEYEALKADIAERGVIVPVELDENGQIIDGLHRVRAATELGVSYPRQITKGLSESEKRSRARSLNLTRRTLSAQQRRELVAGQLRDTPEWSDRRLALAIGVSHPTVAAVREELIAQGLLENLSSRTDARGSVRPVVKAPRVLVTSEKDQERAIEAFASVENAPPKQLDLKRVERLGREQAAEKRRHEQIEATTVTDDGDIVIHHGDFREILPVEDFTAAGAVVITDPPYPREFLPLWGDMARSALGWGCDSLIAMSGQSLLPDVLAQILTAKDPFTGDRWRYRWCAAYLTIGPSTHVHGANVGTSWKPILVFDAGQKREFLTTDVFRSTADDKAHHPWGQNEAGIAALVEAFTKPGDLVVDPFLGGGTTAVVCKALGRRFVGCDIDAAAVKTTRERLAA